MTVVQSRVYVVGRDRGQVLTAGGVPYGGGPAEEVHGVIRA